jgi:hypothetical protein
MFIVTKIQDYVDTPITCHSDCFFPACQEPAV